MVHCLPLIINGPVSTTFSVSISVLSASLSQSLKPVLELLLCIRRYIGTRFVVKDVMKTLRESNSYDKEFS